METKLYRDLTSLLLDETAGSTLAKVMLKHANVRQKQQLGVNFPELYSSGKRGLTARRKPHAAKPVVLPEEKSIQAGEAGMAVKVTLGGLGHKAAADRECADLKNPSVFSYRSAIFPNPLDYGVEVTVKSTEALRVKETGLNQWGVELKLFVVGKRADEWIRKFKDRIRHRNAA